MSRKSEQAYTHLFQYIDANLFKFEPTTFVTDYEQAMRNSLHSVFPGAKCSFCWFHYCQALRRRASKIPEFVTFMHKNKEALRLFRKFLVLPLMKPRDISLAFDILYTEENAIRKNKTIKKGSVK